MNPESPRQKSYAETTDYRIIDVSEPTFVNCTVRNVWIESVYPFMDYVHEKDYILRPTVTEIHEAIRAHEVTKFQFIYHISALLLGCLLAY